VRVDQRVEFDPVVAGFLVDAPEIGLRGAIVQQ
jgi:hypothetical protein